MAMKMTTLSRRSALGALAVIPAAIVAAPAIGQTVDRSEWDRLFAAYERAKAESDADDARYHPIWEAYEAARDAVPHVTVTSTDAAPLKRSATTADREDLAEARRFLHGLAEVGPDMAPYAEMCRDLLRAEEARRAEIDRIAHSLGFDAAEERNEALGLAYCDAQSELLETPAPDAEALLWKLEALYGDEARDAEGCGPCYCAEWINAVMDDARRLLSGQA